MDTIGLRAGKDTYAVKMGRGKWLLYYWSYRDNILVESPITIDYFSACAAIRRAMRLEK